MGCPLRRQTIYCLDSRLHRIAEDSTLVRQGDATTLERFFVSPDLLILQKTIPSTTVR